MFFPSLYFTSKLFCLFCLWLLICLLLTIGWVFFRYFKISGFVSIFWCCPFESYFFHQFLLIYFFQVWLFCSYLFAVFSFRWVPLCYTFLVLLVVAVSLFIILASLPFCGLFFSLGSSMLHFPSFACCCSFFNWYSSFTSCPGFVFLFGFF